MFNAITEYELHDEGMQKMRPYRKLSLVFIDIHGYQNWRTLHLTVRCLHDVLETTAVIAVTGESMQGVRGRYFAAGSSRSYLNSLISNILE